MIDPHVHLRDWNQSHKETIVHGLDIARKAGLSGVFDMPNTDPPLISGSEIKKRIALADKTGSPVFYGVYGGLTPDMRQVAEIVEAWKNLFPRMVGLKFFAGRSTGNLSIISPVEQEEVIRILVREGFDGVLAVHCEKESCFRPEYGPYRPEAALDYTLLRPPESELESIKDMISFTEKLRYKGTLHVCHISTDKSVEEVEKARQRGIINITCGLTPHHAFLYDELMKEKEGYLLKMNPPLRPKAVMEKMLEFLFQGKIDWIETDHAPHTLADKRSAAGIPGLPFYPHFIRRLRTMGMTEEQVEKLTHTSICKTFGIDIKNEKTDPRYDLAGEYEFDAFHVPEERL
ncbi:MAG: dihydroorotase [Spirochaetales bacterium]|nr:dihydroorotase [Spirochaetales bacterium]